MSILLQHMKQKFLRENGGFLSSIVFTHNFSFKFSGFDEVFFNIIIFTSVLFYFNTAFK